MLTTLRFMMQGNEHMTPGCMMHMPGLTPQAAMALQFWLTQGALNPNVHANFLHNLQAPFGDPRGHHMPGLSCGSPAFYVALLPLVRASAA